MTLGERSMAEAVASRAVIRLHTVYPLPVWNSGIASIPLELCDAILVDVEPERREVLPELDRERQPDITKSDDADASVVERAQSRLSWLANGQF